MIMYAMRMTQNQCVFIGETGATKHLELDFGSVHCAPVQFSMHETAARIRQRYNNMRVFERVIFPEA